MNILEIATRAIEEHGAMQKPAELAGFLAIAQSLMPEVVWEIGTATGGTLWALVSALGSGPTYASIDLPGGAYGGTQSPPAADMRSLLRSAGANHLTIVRGDSREVDLPGARHPRLLIIDGDHSLDGVRADWDRYAPLVASGGVIAFHDILPHPAVSGVDVETLWFEIVAREERTLELVDRRPRLDGSQWGGWGLVFR